MLCDIIIMVLSQAKNISKQRTRISGTLELFRPHLATPQINRWHQTLANRGPDSRFVLKAIIKALISKSSRCSILKTHNSLYLIPDSQPDSSLPNYLII